MLPTPLLFFSFLNIDFFHINNILQHTVIHRKLQNVVYMKKSRCNLKKRGKKGSSIGSCPQVPVEKPTKI
jgi:hypothetical protein